MSDGFRAVSAPKSAPLRGSCSMQVGPIRESGFWKVIGSESNRDRTGVSIRSETRVHEQTFGQQAFRDALIQPPATLHVQEVGTLLA